MVAALDREHGQFGKQLVDADEYSIEENKALGATPTGRWSRPDLTLVAVKAYAYLPGVYVEVIPIEVKGPSLSDLNITGVYQAASMLKTGTRSYVAYHLGLDQKAWRQPLNEVQQEAERVGVGVLGMPDPRDPSTWIHQPTAPRHQPDPAELNRFIAEQLEAGRNFLSIQARGGWR